MERPRLIDRFLHSFNHCEHIAWVTVPESHGASVEGARRSHTEPRWTCCWCGRIRMGWLMPRTVRKPWAEVA